MKISTFIFDTFYLDLRSLKLFRFLLGVANIVCAFSFLLFYKALLLNDGIMPSEIIEKRNYYFSVFDFSDFYYWPVFIIFLMIISSITLSLGYFSRFSALILFLISLSIENRYFVYGGTVGLRLGLIWAIFIPLSKKNLEYSKEFISGEFKVLSIPTSCLMIKACIVYFAAFFNKDFYDWAVNNTALYYSLWWGGIATHLGELLRNHFEVTRILTRSVLVLEFLGPCLLLSCYKNGLLRGISSICLLGMHLGIQLTMNLEEFPFANFAITAAFIPSIFWDYFKKEKSIENNKINLKFNYIDIIPTILIILLLWKNLFNFHLAPMMPKSANMALSYLKMKEKWNMFSGGNTYYRFWPIVKANNSNNETIDLWRWYLGKSNFSYSETIPSDLGSLTPNIRWEKFITNITMHRGLYGDYQVPFLKFLCREYNNSNDGKVSEINKVSLIWGWQEIKGVNKFLAPGTGVIKEINCK